MAMDAYLCAIKYAKRSIPKSALFAFNTCIDAVVKTTPQMLLCLPLIQKDRHVREAVLSSLQREITIDKEELSFLRKTFPRPQYRIGGQAGQAAEVARALGVLPIIFPERKKKELPIHYVFEYCNSLGMCNRIIASYEPQPMIPQAGLHLPKRLLRSLSHAFLGGFHLMKSKEEIMQSAKIIHAWKKQNPHLRIFVELGDFQKKEVLAAAKKYVLPPADCEGMNEEELFLLTGRHGIDAIKKLPKGTGKILFHSPNFSFTLPKDEGDEQALLFARLVCSYRAKYGKNPSFSSLAKYAKTSPSLHIENPKFTVGLGDAFSCAYFLAAKR